jgi:hypothetical protein
VLVWCARVPFWLQKSARGVGLREATLVAAGVGDGGLAGKRETADGEWTSRATSPGNGCRGEGPVEGHLLVEGVPGRGNPQSSRVGGGIGLGPSDRSALRASGPGGRQGRQSYSALESAAVNSCFGPERRLGEAVRVT